MMRLERVWRLYSPSPTPCHAHLFLLAIPELYLYNKLVVANKALSGVLWVILENLRRELWELFEFIAGRSEV